MKDKKAFVKDSKTAILGVFNGVFGNAIYEVVLTFLVSLIVFIVVSSKNPSMGEEQLNSLIKATYDSFPYGLLVSVLCSIVTLVVFVCILNFSKFKELCKKAINFNSIKCGLMVAIVIIVFSIVYNYSVVKIFNLDSAGNANQEGVVELIKENAILGFLSVVILAPVCEELTFRYCLFGEINKKNKWLAYIVSGLLFMFMHSIASFLTKGGLNKDFLYELIYLPPYLFSGLALCYAYDKTDNIGSSFVAHALNNLISFLMIISI